MTASKNNKQMPKIRYGIKNNPGKIDMLQNNPMKESMNLEDRSSIPGRAMLKMQKMVLDASLHNTQHYVTDQG